MAEVSLSKSMNKSQESKKFNNGAKGYCLIVC